MPFFLLLANCVCATLRCNISHWGFAFQYARWCCGPAVARACGELDLLRILETSKQVDKKAHVNEKATNP